MENKTATAEKNTDIHRERDSPPLCSALNELGQMKLGFKMSYKKKEPWVLEISHSLELQRGRTDDISTWNNASHAALKLERTLLSPVGERTALSKGESWEVLEAVFITSVMSDQTTVYSEKAMAPSSEVEQTGRDSQYQDLDSRRVLRWSV